MRNSEYHPQSKTHVLIGALIIIIGMVLLLKNFGYVPFWFSDFFFRWQFILILIGLVTLFTKRSKVPGLVLILIGTFFLAPEYFSEFRNIFIPVIVILVGVGIMLRRQSCNNEGHKYELKDYNSSDPDYIDVVAVFSGGERQVTSKNFKGGKITAVFGGAEVNFSSAELASQDVVIEVTAVFGGHVLIIPPEWETVIDVDHVFGGFSDKRYFPPNHQFDPGKRLIIKGAVVFGGGEIKSYK